jgi:hypothetical protein
MDDLAGRLGDRFAPSEAFLAVVESGGFYARHPRPASDGEGA